MGAAVVVVDTTGVVDVDGFGVVVVVEVVVVVVVVVGMSAQEKKLFRQVSLGKLSQLDAEYIREPVPAQLLHPPILVLEGLLQLAVWH